LQQKIIAISPADRKRLGIIIYPVAPTSEIKGMKGKEDQRQIGSTYSSER
jgi:hypothetical protein